MAVSSGSAVFTPPPIEGLFCPRGQLTIKPLGSDREFVFSEVVEFSSETELTESEFRSKSFPRSRLRKKTVFADSLTLSMTLATMNRYTLAALFMASAESNLVQTAIESTTLEFEDPRVGDIFDLEAFDATVASVTDGASGTPKAYELNVHYTFDVASGRLEVIRIPDGAVTTNIAITFSAAAIPESAARQAFGILSTQGLRCKLTWRELGAEGPFNWLAEFWDVELRPSEGFAFVGGDEFSNFGLNGSVYAVNGKPAGQEYGRVVVIPKT
ncbi:hypothetical protein [Aureimonas sp. SK2]|uniref:phage tail tube protein n=1 Tax=Aureimonas sp. SK2 TaxID=3015992 RepID=UPI0024448DFA|nr:hypothetical protein [Aureimonas sp. SK2]